MSSALGGRPVAVGLEPYFDCRVAGPDGYDARRNEFDLVGILLFLLLVVVYLLAGFLAGSNAKKSDEYVYKLFHKAFI